MKTTFQSATRAKRWRFSILKDLQTSTLAQYLDSFEAGYLRDAALIWEALEQRDDLLRTVISKRKKSVARHGWTVLPNPGLAGAEKVRADDHVKALEHFYNHIECEHAVDRSERGGFKLLTRQMMDAVGKRFAVHEILWKESDLGVNGANRNFPRLVEATFRFVPLAFFENTTGRLRFLEKDFALEGSELKEGAWMITVGEGLMIASSTAWMFKNISLDDWLQCSQRNGTPAIRGTTSAARDSSEWTALEDALADLVDGRSVVHSTAENIEALDLMAGSRIPFPELVERIDRMLASLWRGADLSTMSRDRGYGASLQEKETCALEEDDAEMLTETLNRYVDEWVIRHVFGPNEKPLARVKVLVTPRECTAADLQVDEFLIRHGAPLGIQETLNRYGRTLPKTGEPVFLRRNVKASLPESSQNSGTAEDMENMGYGCGPTVGFRGCSPERSVAGSSEESGLPNEFTLQQPEWVQISPFGDFPHARGMQRVDALAAETIIAEFNSFRGRLGRLFGGVPFYVGHPDLPGASDGADRKAYGWVNELAAREDGLYGRVKWSEAGMDLLRNAHFKYYSPYWEAREIGSQDGRRLYRPVALISIGLTNQPNIPVRPLANETVAAGETGGNSSPITAVEPPQFISEPEAGAPVLANHSMHIASCTDGLALRKRELVRMPNHRDRIQEFVLRKMRLGMSYDQAWEQVKREHGGWFQDGRE